MAVQGPRTVDRGGQGHGPEPALERVCDLAGRPRGTGFAVEHRGTVITSHEAVEGLARLVPHTPSGRARVVDADAVTPLPYAGLALARPADCAVHGGALALLVRDPRTRARHLPGALARFAAGDPQVSPSALATALTTHPEPVLSAFRTRLGHSGPEAGETLCALADVTTPALARRVAALIREAVAQRREDGSTSGPGAAPSLAQHIAAYVARRVGHGLAAVPSFCRWSPDCSTGDRRACGPCSPPSWPRPAARSRARCGMSCSTCCWRGRGTPRSSTSRCGPPPAVCTTAWTPAGPRTPAV
ncbi:hypothetical protein ABZ876_34600 [Streptomyces sp. NPDC046931]|uniref:hypothetical protein n=1 Tax=Streptomyces sp. NPDC046931 TaxID=3154806 RepID=UPI0033D19C33